ncbi:MAG TPA: DeoR/GlpR family DNA-binding transcription regulator [Plantibacter sp.]|uniref:DeoR/GlpR family DNA-binding transcription regulator n=1 Tax=unclassified Plantibacter TaxID=2624265 RepID=UPI002C02C1ED|nr:DeoR/GlpR family DNA-binding transcription regulator [Plantibacter sp.]
MALRSTLDAEARRAEILELARSEGAVALDAIAERYEVHQMTIRRDFEALERAGVVRRVRGGVVPALADPFSIRRSQQRAAKERIARKVLPLLPQGGAVGFDASTTVYVLAELLAASQTPAAVQTTASPPPLTIVTNGLVAFDALAASPELRTYLTGGEREEHNLSLVGSLTEQAFSAFHLDCSIVSAMGVHAESGTSESTLAQAAVKSSMASAADRVILVVDSTKLQSHSRVRALATARIDTLVTELDPDDPRLDPYRPLVGTVL